MAKRPITGRKKVSIKPERARKLIREFHVLLKSRAIAESAHNTDEVKRLDIEIEKLGGLPTYQSASISGQSVARGGDSSKLLVEWLPKDFRGSLLEVGCLHVNNACALTDQFTTHVRIDLHSQHPSILEQDFMTMQRTQQFSVLSLSLVVNYVPDAATRGAMLLRAHEFLEKDGRLFFVLPRACIDNSRYCDEHTIDEIMTSIGFVKLEERKTAKLVYWMYRKVDKGSGEAVAKRLLRDASSMNNFAIVLRGRKS